MKPVLRQALSTPSSSFTVRKDIGKQMINSWHYHPEIEFLFIKKSSGTWLIGDYIGHFRSGDVIMLGANLPHCFRHEQQYIGADDEKGETICIKFAPEIFGDSFLSLPEARPIKEILGKCVHGLKLKGSLKERSGELIEQMSAANPGKKLAHLLYLLEDIAEYQEFTAFSSKGFTQMHEDVDKARIKMVYEYTLNHFNEKITIDKVASLLNMTRQSFCRYFKSKTNKSYVNFLIEVRIGAACRMLVEDEKNVTEISYECGYNNISHFNHQFRSITNKRPLQYKRDYLEKV
ncbi:MAG: AraC family transcriptional regulator [Chitinophagaceae bacterium]